MPLRYMGGKSTRSRADSFMSQLLYHLVPIGQESVQHDAKIDSPVIQGHNLPSHYTDRPIPNFWQEIILVVSDVICLTSQRMWKVRATKTRSNPMRVLKQTSTNFHTSLYANINKSSVEITNKMQPCNRIYYFTIHWRLNMFQAVYRSS
jgi:hypothetical protein